MEHRRCSSRSRSSTRWGCSERGARSRSNPACSTPGRTAGEHAAVFAAPAPHLPPRLPASSARDLCDAWLARQRVRADHDRVLGAVRLRQPAGLRGVQRRDRVAADLPTAGRGRVGGVQRRVAPLAQPSSASSPNPERARRCGPRPEHAGCAEGRCGRQERAGLECGEERSADALPRRERQRQRSAGAGRRGRGRVVRGAGPDGADGGEGGCAGPCALSLRRVVETTQQRGVWRAARAMRAGAGAAVRSAGEQGHQLQPSDGRILSVQREAAQSKCTGRMHSAASVLVISE
mmetsp:Transcript_28752/g.68723  ORF Transcript_28752/g.68723 Transcript_28752/m.68723 type:complete len:291 (-) Transcript_28752:21-893(-)